MKQPNKNSQARCNGPESKSKTSGIDASKVSKRPTKRQSVLKWLINESLEGQKVTRFDAARIGDSCWNTTASELSRYDGIVIYRESTKRPTRFGRPVDCFQYWIPLELIPEAQKVLAAQTGGAV